MQLSLSSKFSIYQGHESANSILEWDKYIIDKWDKYIMTSSSTCLKVWKSYEPSLIALSAGSDISEIWLQPICFCLAFEEEKTNFIATTIKNASLPLRAQELCTFLGTWWWERHQCWKDFCAPSVPAENKVWAPAPFNWSPLSVLSGIF